MKGLSIGEVARRAGLRPSALRYYEHAGLIAPQLRANGRRQYDPDVFNTIIVIQFARRAGFTIAETRFLLTGFGADVTASARWRTMATRKQSELDSIIASARHMKELLGRTVKCTCVTLEECGRRLRARNAGTTISKST